MSLELAAIELQPPQLQFGGAGTDSDPKTGLESAGPFDLRFGSTRREHVNVGIVGPGVMIESAQRWLDRCKTRIPVLGEQTLLKRAFPGFANAFHKTLHTSDSWCIRLDSENRDPLSDALEQEDDFKRFQAVVELYAEALKRLASRDTNRPDIVLMCIPEEVLKKARTVEREGSEEERTVIKKIARARSAGQLDFLEMLHDVEQTEEDLLKRDLRHALKARALACKLPIQIATAHLLEDTPKGQDPATRAWNFAVGIYYKSGGVPWRLPPVGPETCFVGISFHHFRTTKRHIVQSSLAQAFSSEGEGFAIRGQGVPADVDQSRNVHLSEEQAYALGVGVLEEYRTRTGGSPLRVVVHKTSEFNEAEQLGLNAAFKNTPIVNAVTLVPSAFRLLRFGAYPPNVGTVCTVNASRNYLFTSGYMPELGTYPGPHVPQPFEVRCLADQDPIAAAQDVFNLTRMNWNTADIRGKWPVTLSYARRVGGILDEYGEEPPEESSFRYFV